MDEQGLLIAANDQKANLLFGLSQIEEFEKNPDKFQPAETLNMPDGSPIGWMSLVCGMDILKINCNIGYESPIITGLMAYGMSGRIFHAPFIQPHPGFEFKAVVERHEKKAARDYPGITSYDQTDDLLNDNEIELIIVNTPNNTHFDLTKQALQAGKHVLVEKPIAANWQK